MIFDILAAIFTLGVPVFLVSWYLFRRLYRSGKLELGVDFNTLKSQLKGMKKEKRSEDFLHRNWMKFGGGFYGVTAVATLLLIELKDLLSLLGDIPGFIARLEKGIVSLIVDFLINQIQNFVTAILWIFHWGDGGVSMLIWAAVAYGGYYLGLRAAERSIEEWQHWWQMRQSDSKPKS